MGLLFMCTRVLCSPRVVYYFIAFVYGFENRNVQNTLSNVVPVIVRINQNTRLLFFFFVKRETSGLHFFSKEDHLWLLFGKRNVVPKPENRGMEKGRFGLGLEFSINLNL